MLSATNIEPLRDTPAPGYTWVPELRVFAHDMFAVLLQEIRAELADPTYAERRHARHATHNRGCGGPLCRRARQNWQNSYYEARVRSKGKRYQPMPKFEKEITEPLYQAWCKYIEEQYEIKRQAKLATSRQARLLARQVQRALDKAAKDQAEVPTEQCPPENLQTAEYADMLIGDLI